MKQQYSCSGGAQRFGEEGKHPPYYIINYLPFSPFFAVLLLISKRNFALFKNSFLKFPSGRISALFFCHFFIINLALFFYFSRLFPLAFRYCNLTTHVYRGLVLQASKFLRPIYQ